MHKVLMAAAAAALAIPATPALAQAHGHAPTHAHASQWAPAQMHQIRSDRYDRRGRYKEPRRLSRNDRIWRGNDGRYYCKRDNGTTGLVIGAAVGGLLGNQVAGSGDKTIGTIIGAVGGGLLGREIDRGELKCR